MNFSYEKFLKPLTSSDKNIKIYDNNNVVKYIINPNNVRTLNVQNNLVYIGLESNKSITLDFSTRNEADIACKKLQEYVDTLKNTNVPHWVHIAVEQEAIKFTKGPTGSVGPTGPEGNQGNQGNDGLSSYQVWLQINAGSQQDYLDSLIGPIGPTGPVAFGDTDELLVVDQTINATVDGKDIEIVTKGSGNLLFKIDRDGWIVNYGVENNPISDIWSSSVTLDDDGNIYFTGGDFTSTYAYVTKLAPNGNVIWQKQLNSYSTGESIVYKNGNLYILMQDFSYFPFYGNMMICKIGTDGDMKNLWVLDVSSFESPAYNVPYGYEITVDDNENIYYVGTQKNFTNGNELIMGKFNTSNSNVEWQKYISGGLGFSNTVMDRGISIKYKDGHVYVTGTLQNNGNDIVFRNDIFVAKYDTDGQKNWAKVIGTTGNHQRGESIAVDDDGNIYLSGFYNPIVNPSPFVGGTNNFYMKINSSGSVVWSKSIENFNRSLVCTEVSDDGHLYFVSIQTPSSTPSRASADIVLFKVSQLTGSIVWQQYVFTSNLDAVWASAPPNSSLGHRVLALDPNGKSIYVAGFTTEGGSNYFNSFLMSFDQKSLPDGTYSNWRIENAAFSSINFNYAYASETTDVFGIDESDSLIDGVTHSFSLVYPDVVPGLTFSSVSKDVATTLLSPNTELFVKGIVSIDDNYILPREAGSVGQVLTYREGTNLLHWSDQIVKLTFNDYEQIGYSIVGSSSMTLHIDPVLGTASGQFDDEYFTIALPFDVEFMGDVYDTVYVGSNSFVTFGSGFSAYSGYTDKNPPVPGIFIEADDRSVQNVYTTSTTEQFVIRYEGATGPAGPVTPGVYGLVWEMTFNKNSGKIDVQIETNGDSGNGFSCIKNNTEIIRAINTTPNTGFRIFKGYGLNNVFANRIYYKNIEGLSYSVDPDLNYPGQSIVSLDFENLALSGGGGTSFTSFGTTYSSIGINNSSSFTVQSGIDYTDPQSIYTDQYFAGSQGLFFQVVIPVMNDDNDRIKLGLQDSDGNWSAHVELTHDVPPAGNMIVRNAAGGVVTFSQAYSDGDVFSMYVDTHTVFFQLNGVTVQTCAFGNTSKSYRFKTQTSVVSSPSLVMTNPYSTGTLNVPIPDGGFFTGTPITATVSVPLISSPSNVFVKVNISHVYVSDLVMNLISPAGEIVTLFVFSNDDEDNFTNTIFTSDPAYPSITTSTTPHTGTFSWDGTIGVGDVPYESTVSTLTDLLAGQPTTGDWVLVVEDLFSPDGGTLIDFSLRFEYTGLSGVMSQNYTFDEFRFYPTGGVSNSGSSGTSGSAGSSGTSGSAGSSGTSGSAGSSGTSGSAGSSGTSGTGFSTISNYSNNRILTSDGGVDTANAEANLTFDGGSLTVTGTSSLTGHTILQQTSELVTTSFGATASTVSYNFASGSVWYHGTANTNYTADFINMPTTNDRAVTATIILSQGVTAYSPTVVKIDGTTQTVKWANGTYSVTANGVDIIGFTFIRSGSAWTQVLGQISTFS